MYVNCGEIKEKQVSLIKITDKIQTEIIVLVETSLWHGEKVDLKNYQSYNNNRESKAGGGIELLIKLSVKINTVKMSEEMEALEELTVRVETRKQILYVISHVYMGKQKTANQEKKLANLIIFRNLYVK